MNVDRTAAAVLLHQFSEWRDIYPAEVDQTHDDLVRIFLDERSPAASPTIGSDLDGATEQPRPAVMAATPGEFAARWNSWPEEQRAGFLRAMQAASERSAMCMLHHDGVRWVPTYGG